ncbi:hypothetical protein IEQ34_015708 [Dendrobium chrysotoxum]|uniref:Uncharacterized protein n=1 Tax=Dendrobium chrysotoxum TaxID=161865 RepID=A0AAV7GHW3_DENCH|nr:hypothetical protein IEQ34_015708 [Dendrobium chrysotoxum]
MDQSYPNMSNGQSSSQLHFYYMVKQNAGGWAYRKSIFMIFLRGVYGDIQNMSCTFIYKETATKFFSKIDSKDVSDLVLG